MKVDVTVDAKDIFENAIWRGVGAKDDPEVREELEALARDKAYARIREKLKAELEQRINDLKRAEPDECKWLQGRIGALELALELPQQLYHAAGGKRRLFEHE